MRRARVEDTRYEDSEQNSGSLIEPFFLNKPGHAKMNSYAIDQFKVTDAILQGVQIYWGERKIYSKCMKKVGSLMLDNLRKIDILQFRMNHKVNIPNQRCCRLNLNGSGSLRSDKSYF